MKTSGGFLKYGYPQSIHFNGIFNCKPTILGILHLCKPESGKDGECRDMAAMAFSRAPPIRS